MATFRPPDPPGMEGISDDGITPECDSPNHPPNANQLSGLAIFMTRLIADKGNYNANGQLLIDHSMIELIQILINTERDRSEADKRRDNRTQLMANQMQVMSEQIGNLLNQQKTNQITGHSLPTTTPRQATYAKRPPTTSP